MSHRAREMSDAELGQELEAARLRTLDARRKVEQCEADERGVREEVIRRQVTAEAEVPPKSRRRRPHGTRAAAAC